MIRAVVAAPAIVTDPVIAAAAVVVSAMMFATDVVGRVVAAVTGLRGGGGRDRSYGGQRQQNLGVARFHSVLPFGR
ncbi:MAG: hypothetical protein QOD66_27 [Solirubrobacteraceae bacterium]|jgi:hypothetical protein|nr:hypothetical protein [Solirubrobacteraceae bacterium]